LSISDEATSLENLRAEHFVIEGYDPYPGIKAPVAV
jgi:thymidylate synthase